MRRIYSYFLLSGLSILALSCRKKPEAAQEQAFRMSDIMMAKCEFALAQSQPVKAELKLFGKVAADNSKLVQVYPIVGGNVMSINAELGDFVQKGEVLATLRSSEVAEFQKQRLDAQSDLALAEKNLQVAKDLFAGKLNSEKDVIAAESEVKKAKSELNRINEVYSIYSLSGGAIYNITAPISGFIVNKDIAQNEQLRADKSDPVFSVAQIDEVWVLANVNESDIGKVNLGYDAKVQTISYPDRIFTGKVDKIFSAIDPSTKAMKVVVKIPNPDGALKPEMSATITLDFTEKSREMIAIPSEAVIFDKSKNWVMVFHDRSHVETRQVEVYRQLGNLSYISAGLKEGEKVISKNGLLVYDALND